MSIESSYKIYSALVGLLCFFVPCISFILFIIFVRGFVPDVRLAQWDTYYSLISATALSSVILPKLVSKVFKAKSAKEKLTSIALIPFMPVFGAAIAHFFLTGPCAYAKHQLSSPQAVTITESVQSATRGGKYCRNKLVLSDSTWHFQRIICGVQPEDIEKLRHGGQVELHGFQSSYGVQVEDYRFIKG